MSKKGIVRRVLWLALGAAIGSFGIHYIHRQSDITEGGVLGMMLLLNHWLGLSPAILTPIMDIACYALAFKFLGFGFIKWSAVSTLFVGAFFKLWESLPPFFPSLIAQPLLAAVLGAAFVGVGVGILVRQGGSGGGDDALALTIARLTRWPLARAYLITDLTVLALSLSYIPVRRIVFSLITVTLSSLIIDRLQRLKFVKILK